MFMNMSFKDSRLLHSSLLPDARLRSLELATPRPSPLSRHRPESKMPQKLEQLQLALDFDRTIHARLLFRNRQ